MSFTRIFRTDFDGVQPNLHQRLGGGSISEPGTGLLTVSCTSGQNCYMYDTTNNAPYAYKHPPSIHKNRLMMAEARLVTFTRSGVTCLAWLGIIDPNNANAWAYSGWYPSNSNFYMQSNNGAGTETSNNWGTYTGPEVTAHKYRIYWNPTDQPLYDPDIDAVLTPNQYRGQMSHDDGGTWLTATATHSLVWDLSTVRIMLGFRNWSPYPAVTLEWSYLDVFIQDEHSAKLGKNDDPALSEGAWEDELELPNQQGPDKWQGQDLQQGVGQMLPGAADQEVRNPFQRTDKPQAAWEDGPFDFKEAGGPKKWAHPDLIGDGQVGAGQRLPGAPHHPAAPRYNEVPPELEPTAGWEDQHPDFPPMPGPKDASQLYDEGMIITSKQPYSEQGGGSEENRMVRSAWEDRAVVQVDPPADYMDEYTDGDGKELLGGFGINFVKMIYPSWAPFGAPSPTNHYTGADKSGKWYVDGLAALQGVFCSGGNLNPRSWRFSQDTYQNPGDHYVRPVVVTDDHIALGASRPGGANWQTLSYVDSQYRWALVGDFDIEVDYKNFSKVPSGSTHFEGYFQVYSRSGNAGCRMGVVIRTDNVRKWRADTNSWNNEYATAPVDGKLRLVRTGSTIEFFRDDGVGGWVSMGSRSTSGNIETAPVRVQFHTAGYEAADGELDFANFTINLGTISYDVGWFSETPGDHRGNTPAMPDRLLVVGTKTSLDLIDPDTRLLWMRFVAGDNNVLDTWATVPQVLGAAWSQSGMLIVAWGQPSGSASGAFLFIDFKSGTISLRREAASTITSAGYDSAGEYIMLGDFQLRNSGQDWSGDDDALAIPSYSVYDCDTYAPDGNNTKPGDRIYYAIATRAGVCIQTYLTWAAAESPRKIANSTEVNPTWFCKFDVATGDLFYMDETNLYRVLKATIDIGINGGFSFTFTADEVKALPGTRQFRSQYTLARFGNDLYLPADEGVYHVDWPSGSFTLRYGRPGSGATYEILPEYNHCTEVHIDQDGANNLLFIGTAREVDGQVVTVRLNDHSIWARSITLPDGRFVTGVGS